MSTCYAYLCSCCASCCRRCHHSLTDPSWCCYCDCCGPRAWWWRCCYGDDVYNTNQRHVPNSIYAPTTTLATDNAPANDGYRLIDTAADSGDVTVFTRANREQRVGSYGTTTSGNGTLQAEEYRGNVAAIGGSYNSPRVPPVKYDHVILQQPLLEEDVTFTNT